MSSPTTVPAAAVHDDTIVRDLVNNLSQKTLDLIEVTKDVSPTIKNSIELIETHLTPYKQPVVDSWMGYGDPLVSALDTKISERKDVVLDAVSTVNDTIVKPVQKHTERVIEVAEERKQQIKDTTTKAISTVCQQTDQVVASVLTGDEDETPLAEDPVVLVKNLSTRVTARATKTYDASTELLNEYKAVATTRATETYQTSTELLNEYKTVATTRATETYQTSTEFVNEYKEYATSRATETIEASTSFVDEYKTFARSLVTNQITRTRALAHSYISRAVDGAPNEQTTERLGDFVVNAAPAPAQKYVSQGVTILSPYVTRVFALALTALVAVRGLVDPAAEEKLSADKPVTKETPAPTKTVETVVEPVAKAAEVVVAKAEQVEKPASTSSKKKNKKKQQEKQA